MGLASVIKQLQYRVAAGYSSLVPIMLGSRLVRDSNA